MRTALAATWTLLLGMALLMLGAGLQGTLVGLRASLEGFPTLLAGIMLAAYYLGYMAGSVVTPGLVNSVGHVRVFAALTSLASVLILLQGVFVAPLPWTLVRILFGFCFAGIYVVAESWLNGRVDNEHRGLLLSIYMLVCYGGLGLGQLLLNVADPRSTLLFILVSILISVAMVPMALTSSSAPEITVPVRVGPRDLFRRSPLGVVGVAVAGAVSGCLFSLGAIYADGEGSPRSRFRCSWRSPSCGLRDSTADRSHLRPDGPPQSGHRRLPAGGLRCARRMVAGGGVASGSSSPWWLRTAARA